MFWCRATLHNNKDITVYTATYHVLVLGYIA